MRSQFFHEVASMAFDRTGADAERAGNLFRALAVCQLLQYFPFASTKPFRAGFFRKSRLPCIVANELIRYGRAEIVIAASSRVNEPR